MGFGSAMVDNLQRSVNHLRAGEVRGRIKIMNHLFRGSGVRFLLPYARPYYRHLLLGTFYALIGASASAVSPALLGMAIDELRAGVRVGTLAWYAFGLVALSGTLSFFRYQLRMLSGSVAVGVNYTLGQSLIDRLHHLDERARREYDTRDLLSSGASDYT